MARHLFGGELSYIGYQGSGLQVRDMLHIEDLGDLICLQLSDPGPFQGGTFNVGGGPGISASLIEITELCQKITGNSIPISKDPEERPGDVPWFITDTARVSDLCNWRPRKGVEAILTDIHEWMCAHPEELRPILS